MKQSNIATRRLPPTRSSSFSSRRKIMFAMSSSIPFLLCCCLEFVAIHRLVNAFVPVSVKPSLRKTTGLIRGISNDEDGEDWRTFRARLVQHGLPSTFSNSGKTDFKARRYAHESTPLVEVGTVLVSIPTRDLCQALEQQYWHRAVVLITKVAQDITNGEEESVPDDQLAQGAKRGRWSYRGILLNRCTDLSIVMDDETIISTNGERIHRGGDLLGLHSNSPTEFLCLHHLGTSDPKVAQVSTMLVGNLCMTSLVDAQLLCSKYKYTPNDFYTYAGFCSWRPGQLEREMGEERKEWRAISVDDQSIVQAIQQQLDANQHGGQTEKTNCLLEAGGKMWKGFCSSIDLSEEGATKRLPVGQLDFYDQMLEVWAEDNLQPSNKKVTYQFCNDSSDLIGPGTLLRAKMPVSNDMLLYDQEFLRSLILVLEETDKATAGILLNHPLAASVDCVDGRDPLALRYGGPIDVASWKDGTYALDDIDDVGDDEIYEGYVDYIDELEKGDTGMYFKNELEDYVDEGDEDESPFLWIHRDAALGSLGSEEGGGTRLGKLEVWIIKENDLVEALQSGFLRLQDALVFSGVCVWEKNADLGVCGGGMREQVDVLESFEVVQAYNFSEESGSNEAIESVWDILSNQQVLVKETLEGNVEAAINAWESCNDSMGLVSCIPSVNGALSDATLRAWVGVNLLGDPLGTFVEIKKGATNQE